MRISKTFLKNNSFGKTPSEAAVYWRGLAAGLKPGSGPHQHRLDVAAAFEALAAGRDPESVTAAPGAGPANVAPAPAAEAAAPVQREAAPVARAAAATPPAAPAKPDAKPAPTVYDLAARRAVAARQSGTATPKAEPAAPRIAKRPTISITRGQGAGFVPAAWIEAGWKVCGRIEDHRGPAALVQAPRTGTFYRLNGNTLTSVDQPRVREALLVGEA